MVRTVVYCKIVVLAIEYEFSFCNAVGIASHQRAEERLGAVYYIVYIVMTLYDVCQASVFVGHHYGYNCAAIVCQ